MPAHTRISCRTCVYAYRILLENLLAISRFIGIHDSGAACARGHRNDKNEANRQANVEISRRA